MLAVHEWRVGAGVEISRRRKIAVGGTSIKVRRVVCPGFEASGRGATRKKTLAAGPDHCQDMALSYDCAGLALQLQLAVFQRSSIAPDAPRLLQQQSLGRAAVSQACTRVTSN